MNLTKNKEIASRIYNAFTTGNINELDDFVDENAIEHNPDPTVESTNQGRQYFKDSIISYRRSFPDLQINISDMVEEGDKIVAHITMSGTNSGPMMGMPPTHKKVQIEGFEMLRFKDGKAVEHWGLLDNLSLMNQLDMTPDDNPEVHGQSAPANKQNITES